MITLSGKIAAARGLSGPDRMLVKRLVDAWWDHQERNALRHMYYTMHNQLVDLGISVPPELTRLNDACGWAKKCVDVMVEHSIFDGFTAQDGAAHAELANISRRNRMPTLYRKATTSALEQCFNLYFVSKDNANKARVSAYPARVCGCTWDDANDCLEAALFVVSMRRRRHSDEHEPDWVNVVTRDYIIRIRCDGDDDWHAEYEKHGLGHLPVFLAAHEPTLERPFGTSRITREVMGYIDSALRANVNEEIAAAFAVSTQKYILGTDGDPFDSLPRWKAYIGSIINIDKDEDGDVPTFGQLPQPSMEPLNVHWRLLCGRMSAATGIHVSQFGQIHDNPASGDAIYQENEPLILKVKTWNEAVKDVLVDVATALLATERGTTFDAIESQELGIVADMLNPAMPTLAQQTDSSVKIASVVPGFSMTKAFWLMNGYSNDEADSILAQIREATRDLQTQQATRAAIAAMFGGTSNEGSAETVPGQPDGQSGQGEGSGTGGVEETA